MLEALRCVFVRHNEECSLTDLEEELRAWYPDSVFERSLIDDTLEQMEEENIVMYREGQILRI